VEHVLYLFDAYKSITFRTASKIFQRQQGRDKAMSQILVQMFAVSGKIALKVGIKIVRNRAEIVKKRESPNPCFYWC